MANMATSAVKEMSNMVLVIVMFALVLGSILGATAFSSITIINVTTLSETYGSAIVAVTAFLAIGGTIIGILFLIKYVVELFDKKKGVGAITA